MLREVKTWVVEKYTRAKKWLYRVFIGGTALAATLTVPIIPTDLQWAFSYETIRFATASGELSPNEYALDKDGETYYINDGSRDDRGFTATTSQDALQGKTKVDVSCEKCAYYDVFWDGEKHVRVGTNKETYDKPRYIEKAPHPEKKVLKSIISASQADAAIAYDTDTDATYDSFSSLSYAYTTTGSNRGLVMLITMEDTTDADRNVIASTYNSITLIEAVRGNNDTINGTTEIWYLANPASGSNTLFVDTNGAITAGTVNSSSYTGVDQSNMQDAVNSAAQSNATSVSYTITTASANAWIIDGTTIDTSSNVTCAPNSGQTEIMDDSMAGSAAKGCAGYEAQTTVGGKTVSWTCAGISCTTSRDWVAAGISIKEYVAPAAVGVDPNSTYLGSGTMILNSGTLLLFPN